MSNKPIIIISSIAIVAVITFIGAMVLNRRSPAQPEVAVTQNQVSAPTPEQEHQCPDIPQDQQQVSFSLVQISDKTQNRTYRAVLETGYPANVAKVVLTYNPNVLKFDRLDPSASVFPIEAPSSASQDGVVSTSRGISGQGTGLVGEGIVTDIVFTEIKGIKNATVPNPVIDLEKSAVYLNNGCAAKAILEIKR